MAKDVTRNKRRTTKKELKLFKNHFYLTVLHDIKIGLNPREIARKNKRSIQSIQPYTTKLRRDGYIRKVGYGTWELSAKGRFITTKKFSWGTHKDENKIELWRMGYRFYIRHDNPIPEIKEQTLYRGGKVSQGRILGCWVQKGKETLDIYGTISRSNNLWDAAIKTMMEIVTCKGYIEEQHHLLLDPMEPLRPDILINTPETKRIANKIHDELGRLRTEFFDAGDSSKTGRPEFEARTLKAAQNALDNLGISNKAEDIAEKVSTIEETMKGFVPQQLAISNALNLQSVTMKELSAAVKGILGLLERLRGRDDKEPMPDTPRAGETTLSGILEKIKGEAEKPVEIDIIKDPGEFYGLYKGEVRLYSNLKRGARIFLEPQTADTLIKNGLAKLVRRG